MQRLVTLICTAALPFFMVGCSTVAPQYPSSLDNVSVLKKEVGSTVKVTPFGSDPGKENMNPLSLRGTAMNSPYQDSYAKYLTEALKQELSLSGKYAADANIEISGTLLKNDVSAGGFVTAYGNIEARVIIKNRDVVKYDKIKSVKHEWDSSFVGGIAIPRAVAEYPNMVTKLLAIIYADPEFTAALK